MSEIEAFCVYTVQACFGGKGCVRETVLVYVLGPWTEMGRICVK